MLQCTTHLSNIKFIKLLLKAVFARDDNIEYRFDGPIEKRKAHATAPSIPVPEGGKILLSGTVNKDENMDPQLDQDWDEYNNDSNYGSNCDVEFLVFVIDGGDNDIGDTYEGVDYIGDDWLWNK